MIIVGIDPGTHNLGLSVCKVDDNLHLLEAIPVCINADNLLASKLSGSENEFNDRHAILLQHIHLILSNLDDKLVAIVYEIPHFDRNKPQSYATLMHHIYMLVEELGRHYQVPIKGYRPTSIKATIGANVKVKGETSKDAVLRCMKTNKELVEAIKFDLGSYTDDAIDSVLIAFKYICDAREAPW